MPPPSSAQIGDRARLKVPDPRRGDRGPRYSMARSRLREEDERDDETEGGDRDPRIPNRQSRSRQPWQRGRPDWFQTTHRYSSVTKDPTGLLGSSLRRVYVQPMRPEDLLCPSPEGLHSKLGGFHIDPVLPVERALITHGHSDHARAGNAAVLATAETLKIMAVRYPEGFAARTEAAKLGETMRIGEVAVTFHPAGHVLGSAQIAVEAGGLRIVASGDYKRRADPT